MADLQGQVTHLWYTMFGPSGTNGVHGTVRTQGEDIKAIRSELRRYETIETQVLVLVRVGQWVIMAVTSVVGFILSDSIAEFLRNIMRAGAGK